MNKAPLGMYIETRLTELRCCEKVGAPTYLMPSVLARIDELEELLKRFGKEGSTVRVECERAEL